MFEHNLPFKTTSFIGREQELAKIADLLVLPDCRLLTLTGAGGIGKTRLAVDVAIAAGPVFEERAYFVQLADFQVDVAARVGDAIP